MNTESKSDKDYMDYVRDAQALRAEYLSDLTSNGWRCMKGFILSSRLRLDDILWLTHDSQE